MSKNATEIAVIGLVPGANIEDPNSSAGTVWQDTLTTVLDQDGAQRAYWGRQVENPSVLHLFVDWDSVEHHHKFMNQTCASLLYGLGFSWLLTHIPVTTKHSASASAPSATPQAPSPSITQISPLTLLLPP